MKPFDKKSTSGLAKKPEKPQVPAPGTGTTPDARPDRAPHPKPKGKKAAVRNMPELTDRQAHTVCGQSFPLGIFATDSTHGREHN